jgi:ribonuclease E
VRDLFSADVERIVVDNADVAKRVKEVIKISSPRAANRVDLYENPVPLFHQANIEREIEMMYSRHVPLPSGGSLVIDSTEAVVAIDVNSGKFRDHNDAEMTAFKTDMEAADEIPRQLKLRDLGGVIICDFIDLRFERHRRELEERLFENFKNDRAKTKVLRMSQFGIIEITRQRMRPSLKRSIYFDCPHCKGAGLIKTPESLNLDVMRKLAIALNDLKVVRVELSVCPDIAFYLLNNKRAALTELEARTKKKILIRTDAKLSLDELKFELFDARDFPVVLEEIGMTLPERPHTTQLGNRPAGHTAQGRGGRGGGRGGGGGDNRNQRKGPSRPLPTRPLDDDEDDLEEDRTNLQREDDQGDEMEDAGRRGFEPMLDREEDPTDIPAILETEAGDEIAEELADEEMGEGQGDDQHHDEEQDERPPQRNVQSRQPQPAQKHLPNNRQPHNRQPDVREPDHREPDHRGPDHRQPGQFNNERDQGQGGPGEGDGRRRRRRRGRRGRGGRGGQNQSGFAYNNNEPDGNVNPGARPPQDGYSDDAGHDRVDEEGYPEMDESAIGRRGEALRGDESFSETQPRDRAMSTDPSGEQTGEPPVRTDEPGLGPDQKPRRRRRRGGRRHRRRNGEGNHEANLENMPEGGQPASSEIVSDEFESTDVEETSEIGAAPEAIEPMEEVAEVIEIEPLLESDAASEAESAVQPMVEAEQAPAPKKTRAKRASRAKAAPKTPKRIPPKKSGKATKASKGEKEEPGEVAQPKGVVRTGSADKHLISDEPVIPQPLTRPRSYSDLDAIPDDYD